MFDTFDGLPVHALVVHAVVVLVPLAGLGVIALALLPRLRSRYGPLVLLASLVATALVPVATRSGSALAQRVGDPGRHAELGDQLLWFAAPLILASLALMWVSRRGGGDDHHPGGPRPGGSTAVMSRRGTGTATWTPLAIAVSVFSLLIAVGAIVQVYRVGESGARTVWGPTVDATTA